MVKWRKKPQSSPDEEIMEEPKIISIEKSISDSTPIQGNKIYFYGDTSKDAIMNLNRQIDEMGRQAKTIQYTYNLPVPPIIELHICSDGGDVFSAMAAVDKIINSEVPVHTYCEGIVASAATLLSSVGHKRFITKNSCMLVHQISSGLWGNYMEFKDEIKNLELIMSLIKSIYVKHTKFTVKELNKLLSHDLYLKSDECLKYGLVDKVM